MKAAVLEKLNSPLTIADVAPGALQYGQVLVRVLASGICGAQLKEIAGEKGNAKFLPHLLGHEGCGIVEEIGVGVGLKRGDRVVMHWRKAAGIESSLPQYRFNGRIIESGRVTTFSEYSICSENRLTRVPSDTPPEFAAMLGCGLSTALATLENEAAFKPGESILIVGCGGLGVNLIHAARLFHAWPIAVLDIHESKRRVAEEMGADFFGPTDPLPVFDVIVDTSGHPEETLPLLADSGRYIMVGQPSPGRAVMIKNAVHLFGGEGKSIKATQGGGFVPHREIPRYIRLHQQRALSLAGIISHRIPLSDINRGLDLVRAGNASRVIVDMAL